MHLGLVSTMMTKLTFRFMLLKRAYTRAQFEELLSHTKFGGIEIAEGPIGFELSLKRSSQPSLVHPADDTIV